MKKINLFEIGKAFYQRASRDPNNLAKQAAHDLARELWHSKKPKDELLAILVKLKMIESTFGGIRVYYADVAEKAVLSGNYEVSIPHEISHRYNERPGRIYILQSPNRLGQCKLGATTMAMIDRCSAYEAKYGYRVNEYFSLEVPRPFSVEKLVAGKISHLRVAGNARGDSIEWYALHPDELKKLIIQVEYENYLA